MSLSEGISGSGLISGLISGLVSGVVLAFCSEGVVLMKVMNLCWAVWMALYWISRLSGEPCSTAVSNSRRVDSKSFLSCLAFLIHCCSRSCSLIISWSVSWVSCDSWNAVSNLSSLLFACMNSAVFPSFCSSSNISSTLCWNFDWNSPGISCCFPFPFGGSDGTKPGLSGSNTARPARVVVVGSFLGFSGGWGGTFFGGAVLLIDCALPQQGMHLGLEVMLVYLLVNVSKPERMFCRFLQACYMFLFCLVSLFLLYCNS